MNTNFNLISLWTTDQWGDNMFELKVISWNEREPQGNFPEMAAKLSCIECFIFINDLGEKSKQHWK